MLILRRVLDGEEDLLHFVLCIYILLISYAKQGHIDQSVLGRTIPWPGLLSCHSFALYLKYLANSLVGEAIPRLLPNVVILRKSSSSTSHFTCLFN